MQSKPREYKVKNSLVAKHLFDKLKHTRQVVFTQSQHCWETATNRYKQKAEEPIDLAGTSTSTLAEGGESIAAEGGGQRKAPMFLIMLFDTFYTCSITQQLRIRDTELHYVWF